MDIPPLEDNTTGLDRLPSIQQVNPRDAQDSQQMDIPLLEDNTIGLDLLPNVQQVNPRDAEDLERIDLPQLAENTTGMGIDEHIPDTSSVNSGSGHPGDIPFESFTTGNTTTGDCQTVDEEGSRRTDSDVGKLRLKQDLVDIGSIEYPVNARWIPRQR